MEREKQEKWMQRIMALICLLIIFFVVFDVVTHRENQVMTEEDKQIERMLSGETIAPEETPAGGETVAPEETSAE